MFKKLLVAIIALVLIFSPLGAAPKKAYADETTDALVEAILKAAASALAGALAEAAAKELTSDAKAEGENATAEAKGTRGSVVPVENAKEQELVKEGNKTAAASKDLDFWKWAEEFVKTVLQKAILDVVVDQIVTYIQGGGKPQFVTDWQGFAEDVAQRAGGEFVESLGLGFLCEPFSLQLQIAVGATPKKFSEQGACTIDKIVGNIEDFRGDFRSGGWLAYGESWKINNNFLGAYIEASKRKGFAKESAAAAAINEATSGDGFLSSKKCVRDERGKQLDAEATAMESVAAGALGTPQYPSLKAQADAARAAARAHKGESCKVVTPGSTLGDLTSKALGSDIDFLLNAEQLGDYVGAIVDALLNRVIEEGLAEVNEE